MLDNEIMRHEYIIKYRRRIPDISKSLLFFLNLKYATVST